MVTGFPHVIHPKSYSYRNVEAYYKNAEASTKNPRTNTKNVEAYTKNAQSLGSKLTTQLPVTQLPVNKPHLVPRTPLCCLTPHAPVTPLHSRHTDFSHIMATTTTTDLSRAPTTSRLRPSMGGERPRQQRPTSSLAASPRREAKVSSSSRQGALASEAPGFAESACVWRTVDLSA